MGGEVEPASCLICRKRKIRCDRTPGACHRCRRLGERCVYSTAVGLGLDIAIERGQFASASDNRTQAGLKRRRVLRSCGECKRAKAKCTGGPLCERCQYKRLDCNYQGSDPVTANTTTTATTTATTITSTITPTPTASASASASAAASASATTTITTTTSPTPSPSSPLQDLSPSLGPSSQSCPACALPEWLTSRNLPSTDQVGELIEIYFAQIHSVRCMGFLHIPSFMERSTGTGRDFSAAEQSGLLYIMCALAAPFYYAKLVVGAAAHAHVHANNEGDLDLVESGVRFFDAGRGWATVAAQSVCSSSSSPGIEALMTQVLLHEYYLRTGDYAKGFLISGTIARHLQVLQLNIEHDPNVPPPRMKTSWAVKESRRRLVWACFLLDAFIECGIDQLRFISTDDIQIQLPCSEDLFVRNIPCVTEMLNPGKQLHFVHQSQGLAAAHNLDLRAYYIRVMAVRTKILRYVKHLEGEIPWERSGAARFPILDGELRELEKSIPDGLKMSTENIYVFKACGRLNLYFALHILLAQTFNDLYRIGVSHLVFPNSATKWIRENAPREFIRQAHRMCITKAMHVGSLLKDLWHCHKLSLVDLPYLQHAQISSSVLVTSLVSWTEPEPPFPQVFPSEYREILESNVQILQYLRQYLKASMYYESANQALKRFDRLFSRETTTMTMTATTTRQIWSNRSSSEVGRMTNNDRTDNPSQFSLEYILNPLGTYPMARKEVDDGQRIEPLAPEEDVAPESSGVFNLESAAAEIPDLEAPRNADEDFIPRYSLDWGSEVPIMDGIGYPTFLDQFLRDNANADYHHWPIE